MLITLYYTPGKWKRQVVRGRIWNAVYTIGEDGCLLLTACHYHGLIECPVVVDETGDPLFVTLNLNGTTYRYDIR